jgi:cell division protein ZapA (FtsZ GTPase activity inhibitor)
MYWFDATSLFISRGRNLTVGSEEKNRITVDIYGSQYKLLASTSPGYVKKVAGHVDDQMKRIARSYPRLDTQRIAVLAAVNMADEHLRLQQAMEELESQRKEQEKAQADFDALVGKYESLQRDYQHALRQMSEQDERQQALQAELAQARKQHEQLQQELAALREQNEQEKQKQAALQSNLDELQRELQGLRNELQACKSQQEETERLKQNQNRKLLEELEGLRADYRNLQEEYAKLQSEYNEWIQLVENEDPGR